MLALSLLPFLPLLQAFPLADPSPCTTYPTWLIQNFTSLSSDAVGSATGSSPPSASFVLTNKLTSVTETISCSLQINYRCVISGTPSDKDLRVYVALRAESVTLQLERVVQGCEGRKGPLHIIGTGELGLVCTGEGHGEPISCKLEEAEGVIEGVAVELAPGR